MAKDVKIMKWLLRKDQGEGTEGLISKRPLDVYLLE